MLHNNGPNARKFGVHTYPIFNQVVSGGFFLAASSNCRCHPKVLYVPGCMFWIIPVPCVYYLVFAFAIASVNVSPVGLYIHQSDGILKPTGYLPKKLLCPPIFSTGNRWEAGNNCYITLTTITDLEINFFIKIESKAIKANLRLQK